MKTVSVIIPAHNEEKNIQRCLSSIIMQDYPLLDVIVIDDGSQDNTKEIVSQYAKYFPFIRLVSQLNQGVSVARNLGLKKSHGEYIMFIDADDNYTRTDTISQMVRHLENKNVDMVVFNFTHPVFQASLKTGVYDLTDIDQKRTFMADFFACGMPWNKLYKRELITEGFNKNLRFTEDELFNLANLNNIHSVYYTTDVFYNYYCAPITQVRKSAVNSVRTEFGSGRNGFFFKLWDLAAERDVVIDAKFDKQTAQWLKSSRLALFLAYDVYFMKYQGLPLAHQQGAMRSIVSSWEFRQMLTDYQTSFYTRRSYDEDELQVLMDKFVRVVNSLRPENIGKLLLYSFRRIFYKVNCNVAFIPYFLPSFKKI